VNVVPHVDSSGCPLSELDGAYVLGALSTAERTAFEQHLPDCPTCRSAVQEIAGLPGLLSRVPVERVVDPPTVPSSLWPRLVAEASRDRRRARWRTVVSSIAAAACVIALAGVGWAIWGHHDSAAPPDSGPTLAFAPVNGAQGLTAKATVDQVTWGTRIVMHCIGTDRAYEPTSSYSLLVILRDGRTVTAAHWKGVPNKDLRIEGDVDAATSQIAALEVRSWDGTPLLRLRL
jgi:Putative zinc-finger